MNIAQLADLPLMLVTMILILYLNNRNVVRWMEERREQLKQVEAEREAWLGWQKAMMDRQFAIEERLIATLLAKGEREGLQHE